MLKISVPVLQHYKSTFTEWEQPEFVDFTMLVICSIPLYFIILVVINPSSKVFKVCLMQSWIWVKLSPNFCCISASWVFFSGVFKDYFLPLFDSHSREIQEMWGKQTGRRAGNQTRIFICFCQPTHNPNGAHTTGFSNQWCVLPSSGFSTAQLSNEVQYGHIEEGLVYCILQSNHKRGRSLQTVYWILVCTTIIDYNNLK